MQFISVLYLPVNSIPTSLSFFKSFCPCIKGSNHYSRPSGPSHYIHVGMVGELPIHKLCAMHKIMQTNEIDHIYEYIIVNSTFHGLTKF